MKQFIKKTIFLFAFSIGIGNAQSQETDFIIHTDMQTGGIQKIMHKNDKHNMNWIFATDGSELEWFTPEFGWGLGFVTIEKAGKKEFNF